MSAYRLRYLKQPRRQFMGEEDTKSCERRYIITSRQVAPT